MVDSKQPKPQTGNDFTDEELLEIMNSSDDEIEYNEPLDMRRFVRDCGLIEGQNKIRCPLIFFCYLDHKRESDTQLTYIMNYFSFFHSLAQIFPRTRDNVGKFYYLDGKAMGLTEEQIEDSRKGFVRERKEYGRYYKKYQHKKGLFPVTYKDKTKQRKIPSTQKKRK